MCVGVRVRVCRGECEYHMTATNAYSTMETG